MGRRTRESNKARLAQIAELSAFLRDVVHPPTEALVRYLSRCFAWVAPGEERPPLVGGRFRRADRVYAIPIAPEADVAIPAGVVYTAAERSRFTGGSVALSQESDGRRVCWIFEDGLEVVMPGGLVARLVKGSGGSWSVVEPDVAPDGGPS